MLSSIFSYFDKTDDPKNIKIVLQNCLNDLNQNYADPTANETTYLIIKKMTQLKLIQKKIRDKINETADIIYYRQSSKVDEKISANLYSYLECYLLLQANFTKIYEIYQKISTEDQHLY